MKIRLGQTTLGLDPMPHVACAKNTSMTSTNKHKLTTKSNRHANDVSSNCKAIDNVSDDVLDMMHQPAIKLHTVDDTAHPTRDMCAHIDPTLTSSNRSVDTNANHSIRTSRTSCQTLTTHESTTALAQHPLATQHMPTAWTHHPRPARDSTTHRASPHTQCPTAHTSHGGLPTNQTACSHTWPGSMWTCHPLHSMDRQPMHSSQSMVRSRCHLTMTTR